MSDTPVPGDAKKGSRKKWILVLAVAVVLAGAAGAATHFLAPPAGDVEETRKKDTVFVPLEQFTVNLADPGGERLAQIALTLEVVDESAGLAIKSRMPSVRNSILLLLSSKRADDLLNVDGKRHLAAQIALGTGRELGWQPPAREPTQAPGTDAIPAPAPPAPAGVPPEASAAPDARASQVRGNPVQAVHFSHFIVQ